jgi:hypothetical protein
LKVFLKFIAQKMPKLEFTTSIFSDFARFFFLRPGANVIKPFLSVIYDF